ncbi:MAG: hypothetical protein NTZ97_00095, partial [Candidatus Moranbacteria bacterium]|nr:hypothetical protein [Candidatus Moranbacteria bacterium]
MRSLKIFFACALGAFIGTIVSLEVNKYFWWIGLLAGTFVGYFAYQFKSVIAGASEAWKKTIAYEPNWKEIGFVCNYLLSLVCILICLILNIYIILKLSLIFKEIFIIQIFCTCYFFIFSTATGLLMNPDSNKLRNELILSTLPIAQKMWRFVILLSPPAMLTFWPMFYICHVLYAMVMTIYWFIRFLIALPELTCRLAVFLNKTVWPVIAAFVKT